MLLLTPERIHKKVFKDATGRDEKNNSKVEHTDFEIKDGSILIAAITSCTNTSNPNVLIGAGLLAKKAVELGLKTKISSLVLHKVRCRRTFCFLLVHNRL